MDLNTNMMVVMDMIAMQNMMAQQQRDMFFAQQSKKTSQLYNGQENGQEKYCENNQSLKQKHDESELPHPRVCGFHSIVHQTQLQEIVATIFEL